jgi:CHAT domain-containing protein
VLSVCQTQLGQLHEGTGSVSRGDDVVGLTRTFMFAGTPAVVASLGRINDAATNQLMTRFHGNLKSGMGKAEASIQCDFL